MRVTINAMLGCARADFRLNPGTGTYLWGVNSAGKSSIALAVAAAFAQKANPLSLPVSLSKHYAHEDKATKESRVLIEDENWTAEVRPTKSEIKHRGKPPPPAPGACVWLDDPTQWKKKQWQMLFGSQLPKFDDFLAAIQTDFGIEPGSEQYRAMAEEIYDNISKSGLELVIEHYREQGAKSKGQWEEAVATTGERQNYGKTKASNWAPQGYDVAYMAGKSEADLVEVLNDEIRHKDGFHEYKGVNKERDAQLRRDIELGEGAQKALEPLKLEIEKLFNKQNDSYTPLSKARVKYEHAKNELDKVIEKRENQQRVVEKIRAEGADTNPPYNCPSCETPLYSEKGKLKIFVAKSVEDVFNNKLQTEEGYLKELVEKHAALETEVAKDKKLFEKTEFEHKKHLDAFNEEKYKAVTLENQVEKGERAARDLEESPDLDVPDDLDELIVRAEKKVASAKSNLNMFTASARAAKAHSAAQRYATIVSSLKEGSVHQEFSRVGMSNLTKNLRKLGRLFGYDVEIEEGQMTINGRSTKLCAMNERWVARACSALAIGISKGSPIVILDEADTLVQDMRTALLAGVNRFLSTKAGGKMAILICCSAYHDNDYDGMETPDDDFENIESVGVEDGQAVDIDSDEDE